MPACMDYTAEETCNILLNHWILRYGTPTFIPSDNGVHFAAHMTQEFFRHAGLSQVFSSTYRPRTNGLVERQNKTLILYLRVYCSRYMKGWDFYLLQEVVDAYNSTRHESTGFSQFMMLTGINRSAPLIFFYEKYEKGTKPHYIYVRETMERLREINKLARRNKAAQLRQTRNYDARIGTVQKFNVGDHVLVFCRAVPVGSSETISPVARSLQNNECVSGRTLVRVVQRS